MIYWSKIAYFNLPNLYSVISVSPLGMTQLDRPIGISPRYLAARKLKSVATMCLWLRGPMFNHLVEVRLVTNTNRWTDGHDHSIYRVSIALCGKKNGWMNSIKVKLGKLVWHRGCIADVSWKLYIKQQLTENSWSAKMLLHWSVQLRPLANHPSLDRPTSALGIACRFT